MAKKKQVFEPENLESIRSAISGLIVEPPETIEPVVYSVDLLSRHDPYYPMVQGEATSRLAMTATRNMAINPITGDAVIEDEGFRAFFEGYDGLKIGLTVGAQKLLSTAAKLAEERSLKHMVGNVLSSDCFYSAHPERTDLWRPMGVLCVEMEISALYANAAYAGKRALGILSISDVIGKNEELSPEDRQTKFTNMMELALDTVTSL